MRCELAPGPGTMHAGGLWQRVDQLVDALVQRRQAGAARDAALADALRTIAAAMRAGSTLQQALMRAAVRGHDPVARACATAAARIALGRSVEGELGRFAEAVGTPAAQLFAQVVQVQHRRGGDLGGPCHRLASLLHERRRLDAEARSATAQARFSARAVLAIPLLLAIAAAWRAPDSTRALLEPEPLLLATPGVMLVVAGALFARRAARGACVLGAAAAEPSARTGVARRAVRRIAGEGTRSQQSLRLAAAALTCSIPGVVHGGSFAGACAVGAVAAALLWPWSECSRVHRRHAAVVESGIEALLEVSIALFAAGATAHEVAALAPASVPEPLRSALAPAVHRLGLGRTIASSYDPLPEVAASPQLDGWLHAICTSAELGAPASAVLEQLLRDARAGRRERLRTAAQTAGPRMQLALVLLVVPGVMWLMLLATVGGLLEQLRAAGVA